MHRGTRLMRFDNILLALIVRKPATGYDAKKWLDTEGLFIRANADQSQIYRTLHKLRRAGLVEQVREKRESGPDAKVYVATQAGTERILALAHEPFVPAPRWQEPDFIARFMMIGPFAPESLAPMIETELEFRRDQVARFRDRERTLDLTSAALPVDPEIAARIGDGAHRSGASGADQWIAWLEAELAFWRARYPQTVGRTARDRG